MIEYFRGDEINAWGDHPSRTILKGSHGARMGISLIANQEYGKEEDHEDQEGLFFAEGTGYVRLDGMEYPVHPDTYILMPAHTKHCFRRNEDSPIIKLLWFHAAN